MNNDPERMTSHSVIQEMHRRNAVVNAGHLDFLQWILVCEQRRVGLEDDCRNIAQWIALQIKISPWRAARMVNAAHALPHLPLVTQAFREGALSLDQLIELTRFITPEDETKILNWALRKSPRAIRERADKVNRVTSEEVKDQERWKELRFWKEDGGRLSFCGSLPADDGARFVKAIDRGADKIVVSPEDDQDPVTNIDSRRAEALVAMACNQIAEDPDPDRATVVVHITMGDLVSKQGNGSVAGGPALHPDVVAELLCDSRLQFVSENEDGGVTGIGSTSRLIPPWLRRVVEERDGHMCTFYGCGSKAGLDAHHIVPYPLGPTEEANLTLFCRTHHGLFHKFGWHVVRGKDGKLQIYRPDWTPYRPGPPVVQPEPEATQLLAFAS